MDHPSIMIYINTIENRIMFKTKTGHNLELLTSEAMKLLGCSKWKPSKDKNSENVLYLEST